MTKALADARYRLGALRDTEVVAQIVYYRDNGTALEREETGDVSPNLPFGQGLDRVYGVVMVGRLAASATPAGSSSCPSGLAVPAGHRADAPRPRRPAAPDPGSKVTSISSTAACASACGRT